MARWYKKWWGILLIVVFIFVIAIICIFGFYVYRASQQIKSGLSSDNLSGQQKYDAVNKDSFWTGTSSPKVTIVEFADFACPHCKASFPVIRALSVKYKNDIKLIYRDFPLLTDHSVDLALAARCAGEQGLFWPMHDKLFMNQGVSTSTEFAALAMQTGANMDKYNVCYNSKKYFPQIQKDISDGNGFGISGTPTWFINGYKIEGDIPMATWEEIITKFLK